MENSIIEQVFVLRIIETIIIMCMLIAIFFLIRFAVKNSIFPKWSYLIWAMIVVIVAILLGHGLINIHLDIKEEAYVTYRGVYEERGGGARELKTIAFFDDNGKEIKLFHNNLSETGLYDGTIVYGKRSKVIVWYSGTPQN